MSYLAETACSSGCLRERLPARVAVFANGSWTGELTGHPNTFASASIKCSKSLDPRSLGSFSRRVPRKVRALTVLPSPPMYETQSSSRYLPGGSKQASELSFSNSLSNSPCLSHTLPLSLLRCHSQRPQDPHLIQHANASGLARACEPEATRTLLRPDLTRHLRDT